MDKYYHFTSMNNLYGIYNYGLVPQKGLRSITKNDDRYGVFLSKGIKSSIAMYASMFDYYLNNSGEEGFKKIIKYQNDINNYLQLKANGSNNPLIDEQIDILSKAINAINTISSCINFMDYLGGYGLLLSVDGVDDIKETIGSEDICYDNVIPPSNINVVAIRDKNNYCFDSREWVLAYFMKMYSLNEVSFNSEYKDNIVKLYDYMARLNFFNCNTYNYDLCEIPIIEHQKIKRF